MPFQTLANGVTLHVVDEGRGQPVVFVHGVMMSGGFFQRQVPYFSRFSRVIVPDLRGHGQSDKVLSGHTMGNYASDLHELFEATGVKRPVLVGWSMGAMVVYEYLKQFGQESVAGIVIVDQPPSDFGWEGYEFGGLTVEALGDMVETLQMDQHALAEEFASLMQHNPVPETTNWMVEQITKVPAVIASTILVNQTIRDYRPFLPEIHVPALVLFGRDNKLTPPEAGEYIASQIKGAQFHVFEESSHCPFYEEADAFNEIVRSFVEQVSG